MLQLKNIDLKKTKTETLVIPVCEDTQVYDNRAIVTIINQAKKLKEFKGEKNDEVIHASHLYWVHGHLQN